MICNNMTVQELLTYVQKVILWWVQVDPNSSIGFLRKELVFYQIIIYLFELLSELSAMGYLG